MRHVYTKDGRLYLRVKVAGKWKGLRTDYRPGQERQARALLDQLLVRLAAGEAVAGGAGPVTVASWAKTWIEERKGGVSTWTNDESVLRLHVLPAIGAKRLDEVRPLDLVCLVKSWRAKMAPKSVHNAYSTVCAMFRDACIADQLPSSASPCILTKRQLGPKEPVDPDFRIKHLFTRTELERLISDEAVPMDRRVEYALKGVAGLRHSEASGLTWERYDVGDAEPLGLMWIHGKGGIKRPVPIHPTLAAIVAEWRLFGWARMMRRDPTPEDLVLPMPPDFARPGGRRQKWNSRDGIEKDLLALGLRHRRGHDLRRTFISLAQSDGAAPTILKRATHKPPTEVFAGYTTFEWDVLCREVVKLKISRRSTGKVLSLPRALAAGAESFATPLVTKETQTMAFTTQTKEPTPGLEPGGSSAEHTFSATSTERPKDNSTACAEVTSESGGVGGPASLDARSNVATKLLLACRAARAALREEMASENVFIPSQQWIVVAEMLDEAIAAAEGGDA